MNPSLERLLTEAKNTGFVSYKDLHLFFPDSYKGGPELDEVLSQLEQAQIAVRADAHMVAAKEPAKVEYSEAEQVYLREVAKVPPLTLEQEIQLAETIAKNGMDAERAKKDLVEANLRLVVAIAPQYQFPGIHNLHVIEHGNDALLESVNTFHPLRGYRFSTRAIFWIHRALNNLDSLVPETPIHRRYN